MPLRYIHKMLVVIILEVANIYKLGDALLDLGREEDAIIDFTNAI